MTTIITSKPYPVGPFFYAARVEGELCGRDNEVVISSVWVNASTGDGSNGPHIWSSGNILIVSADNSNGALTQCDPGVLTATAVLDGVQIGQSITLTILAGT